MDKTQKEVIKRKKQLVAQMMDFSEESQEMYKERGLLDTSMMAIIMVTHFFFKRGLSHLNKGVYENFWCML